jgi:hypothetical protein
VAREEPSAWSFDAALAWLDSTRSQQRSLTQPARRLRRYLVLDPTGVEGNAATVTGKRGRLVASFDSLDLVMAFVRDQRDHGRDVFVVDGQSGAQIPTGGPAASLRLRAQIAERLRREG